MRRWTTAVTTAVLAVAGVPALALLPATAAHAEANGLALTPPMGFNDWNAFGCNTSEALIKQTADAMVANGMKAAGYRYVNIDDCWQTKDRDAQGDLVPDPAKFPDGMKALADYIHSKGLRLGIYEDAGTTTCGGYPGSLGHEQQDADLFASWGVDYLKYDQCNIPFANWPGESHQQVDQQLYTTMSNALKATGRSIVYSMCNGTDAAALPWLWGASVSNLWRTTTDISDAFASMVANMSANAQLAKYAKVGAWNDPDMLEIGNGGMTTSEYISEMSLWSEMAAPLIAGTDLRTISKADLAVYTNKDVIAVDQDRLGKQGRLISSAGGKYVFAKPLSSGDVAVLVFNATDNGTTIDTSAAKVGLPKASVYAEKNLWSKATTESAGPIGGYVPAHATVMYRVSAARTPYAVGKALSRTPNTQLSLHPSSTVVDVGGTATVTVRLADNAVRSLDQIKLALQAPKGWTVTPAGSQATGRVAHNRPAVRTWKVRAPASGPPISAAVLTATATYHSTAGKRRVSSKDSVSLISPVASSYKAANTTGTTAVFGQSGTSFAIRSAGTGISAASTSSRGAKAASDAYAAVYLPGGAASTSTAQVTVTANPTAGGFAGAGGTGLVERTNVTAPSGSPEGVALYVTSRNAVTMVWNVAGGSVVDTTASTTGVTVAYPVQLRLVRNGSAFTGWWSTDGGTTWKEVGGTATVATTGSTGALDVGVFHASGSAASTTEGDVSGFSVS
jgi:alpha-galactosidase